jgi:hypothetical protein
VTSELFLKTLQLFTKFRCVLPCFTYFGHTLLKGNRPAHRHSAHPFVSLQTKEEIQHNNRWNATLSIMICSIMRQHNDICRVLLCRLEWSWVLLIVANKPRKLSVVMLNVIMLRVVMLNVMAALNIFHCSFKGLSHWQIILF